MREFQPATLEFANLIQTIRAGHMMGKQCSREELRNLRSSINRLLGDMVADEESDRMVGKARGWKDVGAGEEKPMRFYRQKPHTPAPWCQKLYSKTWEQIEFAGVIFARHKPGRFASRVIGRAAPPFVSEARP